jgi:hypothetical protein
MIVKFFTRHGILLGRDDTSARSCDASSPVPNRFSRDEGVAPTLYDGTSQLP